MRLICVHTADILDKCDISQNYLFTFLCCQDNQNNIFFKINNNIVKKKTLKIFTFYKRHLDAGLDNETNSRLLDLVFRVSLSFKYHV